MLAAGIVCYLYPEDVRKYTKEILYLFKKEQKQTTEEAQQSTNLNNLDEDDFLTESTQAEDLQKNKIVEELKPEPITKAVPIENYYVIIGSFQSETNAQKFVNQKQKEYPNVVNLGKGQRSGLYMIGIGPYTKADAEIHIQNGKSGWWMWKK